MRIYTSNREMCHRGPGFFLLPVADWLVLLLADHLLEGGGVCLYEAAGYEHRDLLGCAWFRVYPGLPILVVSGSLPLAPYAISRWPAFGLVPPLEKP